MTQERPSILYFQALPLLVPDLWKYGMLILSILLLLVALIILTCQLCKCWKFRKSQKVRNLINNAQKEIDEENAFQEKRSQTSLVGFEAQSSHEIMIQNIRKELKKLGVCCSPSSDTKSLAMGILANDLGAPDRSQGKLRFSLLYNKKQLELILTVTGALGLPRLEYSNTFVQVRLLSQATSSSSDLQHIVHEWQTQVVKTDSSPTFGDQFACTLQEADLTKSSIKLEVKCFDKYSRHIPLGEVRVSLNTLKAFESMEFCRELQKATKDTVGEVLVSLKCLPISQRIEIGLLKVKTTFLCNNAEKRIYARIDVFCNLHKQKHQKSKPKTLASMTIFNETFFFHLPEPVVWDCAVLISIYEMHPKSRQLVGQAALGKGESDNTSDHWECMMRSIQQPVAKWHPLVI
nr:PREDICTED: synaptotagmin-2 [Anolis carolinensis]|eukprot:XP_008106849.2 PREDICTED: synaptotagmin-2 [Anolis carolinensis]